MLNNRKPLTLQDFQSHDVCVTWEPSERAWTYIHTFNRSEDPSCVIILLTEGLEGLDKIQPFVKNPREDILAENAINGMFEGGHDPNYGVEDAVMETFRRMTCALFYSIEEDEDPVFTDAVLNSMAVLMEAVLPNRYHRFVVMHRIIHPDQSWTVNVEALWGETTTTLLH